MLNKRVIKEPCIKYVNISYWHHPYAYCLCAQNNSFYDPIIITKQYPLIYKINMKNKTITYNINIK